eukprot:UN25103
MANVEKREKEFSEREKDFSEREKDLRQELDKHKDKEKELCDLEQNLVDDVQQVESEKNNIKDILTNLTYYQKKLSQQHALLKKEKEQFAVTKREDLEHINSLGDQLSEKFKKSTEDNQQSFLTNEKKTFELTNKEQCLKEKAERLKLREQELEKLNESMKVSNDKHKNVFNKKLAEKENELKEKQMKLIKVEQKLKKEFEEKRKEYQKWKYQCEKEAEILKSKQLSLNKKLIHFNEIAKQKSVLQAKELQLAEKQKVLENFQFVETARLKDLELRVRTKETEINNKWKSKFQEMETAFKKEYNAFQEEKIKFKEIQTKYNEKLRFEKQRVNNAIDVLENAKGKIKERENAITKTEVNIAEAVRQKAKQNLESARKDLEIETMKLNMKKEQFEGQKQQFEKEKEQYNVKRYQMHSQNIRKPLAPITPSAFRESRDKLDDFWNYVNKCEKEDKNIEKENTQPSSLWSPIKPMRIEDLGFKNQVEEQIRTVSQDLKTKNTQEKNFAVNGMINRQSIIEEDFFPAKPRHEKNNILATANKSILVEKEDMSNSSIFKKERSSDVITSTSEEYDELAGSANTNTFNDTQSPITAKAKKRVEFDLPKKFEQEEKNMIEKILSLESRKPESDLDDRKENSARAGNDFLQTSSSS